MRVFIPVTDFKASQARLYVGYKSTAGHLYPRIVKNVCVFFYPEFWQDVDDHESLPFTTRRTQICNVCKYHAAINKGNSPRTGAPITEDQMQRIANRHPLAVPKADTLSTLLSMEFDLLDRTNNQDYLNGILDLLQKGDPDAVYGANPATGALYSFMNFDEPTTRETCVELAGQLKATSAKYPNLDPDLVQFIHGRLCTDDSGVADMETADKPKLGHRLAQHCVAFFLRLLHRNIPTWPEAAPDFIEREVYIALAAAEEYGLQIEAPCVMSGNADDKAKVINCLRLVRRCCQSLDDYGKKCLQAVAEHHGGLLKHASIEDIMNKFGNCVDIASAQQLMKQLGALHAALFASQTKVVTDMAKKLDNYVVEVMKSLSME
ncbi:Uu.00g119780.m01.CDS01 [Anthostomella pinea]|uniref:Uu.00g119780.m01.CDS01 n=1 Tax=Anthostomella pinea TaxID=933095 RepID=A0AAI8VHP7_9PEZI|nr:Uu.00g119780.m01.CDS01 [Anthostomella pinea]